MKKVWLFVLFAVMVLAGTALGLIGGYTLGVGVREATSDRITENAVVTVNTTVYSDPLMKSNVVDYLVSGSPVTVDETVCDFYHVSYTTIGGRSVSGWALNSDINLTTGK